MMNAKQYAAYCQKAVADYRAGKLTLHAAAARINSSPSSYPFSRQSHPMLYKIADHAFDIAENYRSPAEDEADWEVLTAVLARFASGHWDPTHWTLIAMYGEHFGKKLTNSFSLSVSRQDKKVLVETASGEIKKSVVKVINKLNTAQTDEQYIKNLLWLLPEKIGKFSLGNTKVVEHLAETYLI